MQLSLLENVLVDDLSSTKHIFGLYIHPLAEAVLHDNTNRLGKIGLKT
jgi:hypothetical protein